VHIGEAVPVGVFERARTAVEVRLVPAALVFGLVRALVELVDQVVSVTICRE
jgi:hypothetical protein